LADVLGDARRWTVATIRLAEAHRSSDRLELAERLLREALGTGTCRDFGLQHLGKTLLDAGRRDEAIEALEAALLLRRAAGNPALVASTEQALALARRRND
jgi:tetratricopeptide (TPR) repeat protein